MCLNNTGTLVALLLNADAHAPNSSIGLTLTYSGQADFGIDYTAPTQLMLSDYFATIDVVGVSDSWYEGNESLTAALVDSSSVVGDGPVTGVIYDDTQPSISLSLSTNSIREQGGGNATTLYATLTNAANNMPTTELLVPLDYTGSADADVDFSASSPVTISAGTTVGHVTLTGTPDLLVEGNETFVIKAAAPDFAAQNAVTGTIIDTNAPTISLVLSQDVVNADAPDNTALIYAILLGAPDKGVATPFVVHLDYSGMAELTEDFRCPVRGHDWRGIDIRLHRADWQE